MEERIGRSAANLEPLRGLGEVVEAWRGDGRMRSNVVLEHTVPPSEAHTVPLPADLDPALRSALLEREIFELFSHQADAYARVRARRHVVIATPTASGKSLCYNLPILQRFKEERAARALYLFPTKALSRDQEHALRSVMGDAGLEHGAITYDGDTPADARRAARERSGILITNPDMLHAGILPHHASWARFFANLEFVVIDEVHSYRGVFGSHLANLMRRLHRVARFHGSTPTFIFSSATIGNPGEHASRIVGSPVSTIDESGAPRGPKRVVVYNPPIVNSELGIRQSYVKAAVSITAALIRAGVPTIVFGNSRNSVEVMLKYLRDRCARDAVDPDAIQAYRGGYLPEQRRRIERDLREGRVRCVVATSALELGIDIGGLDAVVCASYPGSLAGLWQRFGRAGRRGEPSLAVLVSSSAPLDQFFAKHPSGLIHAGVESARIDPDNVEILIQHVKCASFELPFEQGEVFGDLPAEPTGDVLKFLADNGVLHPAPGAGGHTVYHWASDSYPANHVSLRSVGWDNFVIVDVESTRTIAEMDWRSTHTMLHEQAIYQHAGDQYQVERLDFDNHKAFVRRVKPDYYTDAMTHTRVAVTVEDDSEPLSVDVCEIGLGEVSVVEKVVGYKKIKFHSHENVGYGDVRLPEMQMHTSSIWFTFSRHWIATMPAARPAVIDALRGVGRAMHTVACIGLMTDPRDLGRTLCDRDGAESRQATESDYDPTLFLYDQMAGGVGLAARLFEERDALVQRARDVIASCPCELGCPGCIGPTVGAPEDGADALATKELAVHLLDSLLASAKLGTTESKALR